jgi:hypothetical protein
MKSNHYLHLIEDRLIELHDIRAYFTAIKSKEGISLSESAIKSLFAAQKEVFKAIGFKHSTGEFPKNPKSRVNGQSIMTVLRDNLLLIEEAIEDKKNEYTKLINSSDNTITILKKVTAEYKKIAKSLSALMDLELLKKQ